MGLTKRISEEYKAKWPIHLTAPVYSVVRTAFFGADYLGQKLTNRIFPESQEPLGEDFETAIASGLMAYLIQLGVTATVTYDLTKSIPVAIASLVGQIGITSLAGNLADKLNNTDRKLEDKLFDECLKEKMKGGNK